MKLFTSALFLALSALSTHASAVTLCKVEISFNGALDGATCNIPAGSSLEILTAYTQCHVPVVLDEKCNLISYDFTGCIFENTKIESFVKKGC